MRPDSGPNLYRGLFSRYEFVTRATLFGSRPRSRSRLRFRFSQATIYCWLMSFALCPPSCLPFAFPRNLFLLYEIDVTGKVEINFRSKRLRSRNNARSKKDWSANKVTSKWWTIDDQMRSKWDQTGMKVWFTWAQLEMGYQSVVETRQRVSKVRSKRDQK